MNKDIVRDGSMELPVVKISVRNLVEFLLRSGDINTAMPTGRDQEAMLAGGRIHRKIQKSEEKKTSGRYHPEVTLSFDTAFEDLILRVEGRADGILDPQGDNPAASEAVRIKADQKETARTKPASAEAVQTENTRADASETQTLAQIDEIKGMYLDVSALEKPFPVHLAQAKCYAYIYAEQNSLPRISVQMTYVNLDTEEVRRFLFPYDTIDLKKWFENLIKEYHKWARWQLLHRQARDASMKHLEFPFPYRKGQQKLTAAVYHTIVNKKELFLMAPTGVGKTLSCVFPAVRAVGEGYGDRIFYLTAKNETLSAGEEAFQILRQKGLNFLTVRITAKEKICPLREVSCTPKDCPYAKGHFDRVNDALYHFLTDKKTSAFDHDNILKQAEEYRVCPYELTRDLTEWVDGVLCDYNYVFDPNARLKKFFHESAKTDTIFLIDEAHNLVERGRRMYSASLCKEHVLAAKRALPKESRGQRKALEKVNALLLDLRHRLDKENEEDVQPDEKRRRRKKEEDFCLTEQKDLEPLFYACLHAYEKMQELFQKSGDGELKEKLLDFYFELGTFCSVFQNADEHYEPYLELAEEEEAPGIPKKKEKKKTFSVQLFCIDPSALITDCIDKGRAAVFFSATLLPVSYYKELLTVKDDCYAVYAESPFSKEHRKILISRDVSTRYTNRGYETYRNIAFYISAAAKAHKGNYFVFFPSYRMMRDVFEVYRKEFDCPEVDYVMQSPVMGEMDREIFLENFYENAERSLVAFAVMGGIFSEGIDLAGTKLVGAVIVGAGLPPVSSERKILEHYYKEQGKSGFDYAYLYPGMNKVEQAAGRVIRTDSDKGVILLLDQRFLGTGYRELFPREWADAGVCRMSTVESELREFWANADGEDPKT